MSTIKQPRRIALSARSIRAALKRAPGRVWTWNTHGWWDPISDVRFEPWIVGRRKILDVRLRNLSVGVISFAVWTSPILVVESETEAKPAWKPHPNTIKAIHRELQQKKGA